MAPIAGVVSFLKLLVLFWLLEKLAISIAVIRLLRAVCVLFSQACLA